MIDKAKDEMRFFTYNNTVFELIGTFRIDRGVWEHDIKNTKSGKIKRVKDSVYQEILKKIQK